MTEDDLKLADRASAYWGNFVRSGDPNIPLSPTVSSRSFYASTAVQLDLVPSYTLDSACTRHDVKPFCYRGGEWKSLYRQ